MASISFTYNGNYNENEKIVYRSQFDDVYTNNSSSYSFTNNDWGYGFFRGSPIEYSTSFADDDRGVNIGDDYAVNLDFSGNNGSVDLTGGRFGDIFRGGSDADTFIGLGGNDTFEGGAGGDTFNGGSGIDTVSYANAASGVRADLLFNVNIEGDANGDTFDSIENLTGSAFADDLRGDDGNNTLRGNGGEDNLNGQGGNDRLVAKAGAGDIIGGAGIDSLFVVGGGTFTVDPARFVGIEKVFVREGTNFDMSESFSGMSISSNSRTDAGISMIGSRGNDRISAGSGGDTIEGHEGNDKLFAGAGADTFHFEAGFGRDNVYGFNVATDHITVDITGVDATDIKLTSFHDGQDTIVSFVGIEGVNKIILHDVTVNEVRAVQSELFTFGA